MYLFRTLQGMRLLFAAALLLTVGISLHPESAYAQSSSLPPGFTPLTTENPKGNSFGLEGKISAPPPKEAARITVPSGGQSFSASPITISGICPKGLLVEILNNGVMVGSTFCQSGSFSLQAALFPGNNEFSAVVVDDLGQEGPASNTVTVQYVLGGDIAQFSPFKQSITLTSSYSRRSADPGVNLIWPLQLSGGTGPYAFSIDWGDGSGPELLSQPTAGIVTIKHAYKNAGIYQVTVRVKDVNGVAGFLQVIAVANGKAASAITSANKEPTTTIIKTQVLWIPAAVVTILLIPAFWLGRRHEAREMRLRLEHEAEMVRKLDE
jgi:hypothetical protein